VGFKLLLILAAALWLFVMYSAGSDNRDRTLALINHASKDSYNVR